MTAGPTTRAPLRVALGERTAAALEEALGLRTVGDLLRHYPRRYLERGELTDLRDLVPGENATIQARVVKIGRRQLRPKLVKHDVVVTDGRSELTLTFFNARGLEQRLPIGADALFAGKVELWRRKPQLTNPEMHVGDDVSEFAGSLLPLYPATAKMPTWKVRRCLDVVLDTLDDTLDATDEVLPKRLRLRRGLLALRDAFVLVHRPQDRGDVQRAQDRLRWDEAFVLQVALAQRRAAQRALPSTRRLPVDGGLREAFEAQLPFTLTAGQRTVAAELAEDLGSTSPMHRLLQGEVGSGKTVVALQAMLTVVDTGGQAALLAPTEVLAQQHARSIRALLGPLAEGGLLGGADAGTRVALLTGSQPAGARRANLLEAASGAAGIVVGTHALLEDTVQFADLGLVVVDEQHRFGVEQRDRLRAKADPPPHVLVMTATPIPRTIAMTVFGDLEVSTLAELPAGRAPLTTHVVPAGDKPHFLERAWARVREEVAAGHQAFVVCPRIGEGPDDAPADDAPADDDGERRPALAVLEVAPLLVEGPLHGLRVRVLHGRMPPEDKDAVMQAFGRGEIDVLVATTVIEVGVDVPRATVMVVLDAERFGVSQLHQLRGRVGRGAFPGLALLVTELPAGAPGRTRLEAVAATSDGFALSQVDLETRREGDVLGASQSGRRSSLRLLSVLEHEDVIAESRAEALDLLEDDPSLRGVPGLRAALAALSVAERADYLDKA